MVMRASHPCGDKLPVAAAVAILAGALFTALAMAPAIALPRHKTYTVLIENMRFSPAVLSVRRGDRVVWINKDMFPHTVTSDVRRFDSGEIASDASWSYIVSMPGEYAYSCRFHPSMKGRLQVQP
jgi:plastocyanin